VGTAEGSARAELLARLEAAQGVDRAALALKLGALEFRAGEVDRALERFAAARQLFSEAGERRHAAEAEAWAGLGCALRGDGVRGRALIDHALIAADGDPDLVARIELRAAEAATATGDTERARLSWERARAHYEVYWDGAALAAIYGGLAVTQAARGQLAPATRLASQALDEAEAATDPQAVGRALLAGADVATRAGDDTTAERALRRAARVLEENGLERDLAEACLRFGVHLGSRGLDGAAAWLARAHETFRGLGALRDVERVRDAFRRYGRRISDRTGEHEAQELVAELRRQRQGAADPERLADIENRLERALDSLIVERDRTRTLLELLRGLAARGEQALLPLELARLLAPLVGADRALVALVDDTGVAEMRGSARMPEGELAWREPVAQVARPGGEAGLFLADDPAPSPLTGRAIACPLIYRERVFGAVYCDRVPSGGQFTVRDLDLLAVFAAQAALLFEHGRVADELRRALRMRDAALDAVGEGIVVVRPDGVVEALNGIAARLLGLEPAPESLGPDDAKPSPVISTWPELAALARGDETDRAALRLPGGACLARARRVRSDSGAPAGAIVALTETRTPGPAAARRAVSFDEVVGSASVMRKKIRDAEYAARSASHVLIVGEAGTGKRLLAHAVAGAELALVDCAALPRGRGPLFGPAGVLDLASGGALILAEVAALDSESQQQLLAALTQPRKGGRIIATSSAPPGDDAARRFQRELRQRLGAVYIELPPLRERPEDLPLLVERFAERASARLGKSVRGATPEVLDVLRGHGWPGNVRELEELVAREVARVDGEVELLVEVPAALAARATAAPAPTQLRPIAEVERQLLLVALRQHRGNVPKVARSLGVSKGTVYNMMRKFHVDPTSYRVSS
jgi:transcriptional regulator with AAA-type ATPase domain